MNFKQTKVILFVFSILLFFSIPFQNCAKQGSAGDSAKAVANASTSLTPATTNPTSTPVSYGIPLTDYFSILPGTGSASWNTVTNPMVVYVGQTLKITNSDSVAHKLVTTGKPCPDQSTASVPSTGIYNCVISSDSNVTTLTKDYVLFDQTAGSSSKFYVRVYDGTKIYAQKCSGCHNSLSSSEIKGNDVSTISWAKQNVSAMSGISLTPEEIEALEISLRY